MAASDPLAHDRERLAALLEAAHAYAVSFIAGLNARPVAAHVQPERCQLPLPEVGLGAQGALDLFRARCDDQLSGSAGPRYLAFVTGGSTPAALMADWLVASFDQNALLSGETIAPHLEHQALSWLGEMLGLSREHHGICVTGATMANTTGLATARQWLGEQRGVDLSRAGLHAMPPLRVLSGSPHASIYKALSMLGIGSDAVERVACLPGSEAVDVAALEQRLHALAGQPIVVVGNAGVVNNGDFDDLEAIARLKERSSFWLHVDGAFGLCAAASPRFAALTRGVEHADSVTVDGHKWLNVPYDAGYAFTRHLSSQMQVFKSLAPYLPAPAPDPRHYLHLGPENSRRWRALPLWFTLLAYGRAGVAAIIDRCCDLARQFGDRVAALPGYTLAAPVRLNIACITLAGDPSAAEVAALNQRLAQSGALFLSPSAYLGKPVLRAAFSNWSTSDCDIELMVEALLGAMAPTAPNSNS